MSADAKKDLLADAKNFCDGLGNVFMMKKRDPQTRHLLEKAKHLIEALSVENQKSTQSTARSARGGGMGQLWVKLDELKRENEELKKGIVRSSDEKFSPTSKHAGPGEVIISELHKTRSENELLKSQVEKLQTSLKELETINVGIQDEYRRAKIAFESVQKSLETVREDNKRLESSLNSAKTENATLKSRSTHTVKPMIRCDNRYTENINERCRPSAIAMQYTTLESQEWVDAKESLEDSGHGDEELVTQFLCNVMIKSFESSLQLLQALESVLSELLRRPTLSVTLSKNDPGDDQDQRPLSEELGNMVKEQLRANYDGLDEEVLGEIIKESINRDHSSFPLDDFLKNKAVNRYINECARVAWQMAIQQPPMYLTVQDATFDDERHKLWWSCDQSKARRIKYFIWPALYDFENGNLLVKGCVYAS